MPDEVSFMLLDGPSDESQNLLEAPAIFGAERDADGDDIAGRLRGCIILVCRFGARKRNRLIKDRSVVRGAPSYFGMYGMPREPGDLREHNAALRGIGLVYLARSMVQPQLESCELVKVLSEYEADDVVLDAIYVRSRHNAAKIQSFIDFLAEQLPKR